MTRIAATRIEEHFADLTDPRQREVVYPLTNIVVIALCAATRKRVPRRRG
jgi:hypothetical protein